MKLLTLNIWGGQIYEPFINFIKEQSDNIGIFCFQEVFNRDKNSVEKVMPDAKMDIFTQIQNLLPNHNGLFSSAEEGEGLAFFVNKHIHIENEGDIFVYRWRNSWVEGDPKTLGRNLHHIQFSLNGKCITVANLHGLWNGGGKSDSQDRIEQSEKTKTFLNTVKGAKILCGDFNLLPDTKSLLILEDGMKNLVKEYKITSTRTRFYTKPEKFADYILVSPEINVLDFKVLPDEVSDHSPLYLEFDL